jgi:RimJ/RimL family protein N-acetyltransferase
MFSLTSSRLRLIPLTLSQLQLLATGRHNLEQALGLQVSSFELTDQSFMAEFNQCVEPYLIPQVAAQSDHYEWFTHWLIVERDQNLTVGGIGVAGLPDEAGETMLGYFVDRKFEGLGIATEAVNTLAQWLFLESALQALIADIPLGHIGSQRVLEKAGFIYSGPVEEGQRWLLSRLIPLAS